MDVIRTPHHNPVVGDRNKIVFWPLLFSYGSTFSDFFSLNYLKMTPGTRCISGVEVKLFDKVLNVNAPNWRHASPKM